MNLVRQNNLLSTLSNQGSVIARTSLILVVYGFSFLLLVWFTVVFEVRPDVAVWYPSIGLSFAFLLTFGWRYTPVVALTYLLRSFVFHQNPPSSDLFIGWVIFLPIALGVTSELLRRLRFTAQFKTMRDVVLFVLASAIVSAILSVVAIAGDTGGEAVPLIERMVNMITWWIGQMTGLVVMTPFLLIYVMPLAKQFADGTLDRADMRKAATPRPRYILARVITLLVVLYLEFGVPALKPFLPLYLIVIYLIWISLERGMLGASAGNVVVSFAIMAALWIFRAERTQLSAVQLLMLVQSIASLFLGVIRTEQIEAGEKLRKSEKRFRALVENSREEISLMDMDGTLLFESPTKHRTLGYPSESFLRKNLFVLLHPDDQPIAATMLEEAARESGSHRTGLFRAKRQDGSWRWLEGTLTNLLDEPAVQAMVINYRDVTERKQAEIEIQTRSEELSTLYELSRALAKADDLDTVLDLVGCRTVENVRATFCRIALLDEDELFIRSAHPIRALGHDLSVGSHIPMIDLPYCKKVLEQDEPIILRANNTDMGIEERTALLLDFAQTLCLVPLRIHEFETNSSRILGLLMVGEARHEEREPFTLEKIRLLRSIGDQAAIAIDNIRLFHDLQKSNTDLRLAYDATIAGWSAALDLRDKETEGHTQRVTEMTLRLAEQMEFSKPELVNIRRGALLHDIGKMGVPDRILLKPDKLTDEEWQIMRMHPDFAYQMLKPITYLSDALDIPYCHHEKWDGTGYSRGLKGEQIPLAARIFAVVDVYDALTSDRPYRKGWSREKTLDHIRELSGRQFDPRVVEMFLNMMKDHQDL